MGGRREGVLGVFCGRVVLRLSRCVDESAALDVYIITTGSVQGAGRGKFGREYAFADRLSVAADYDIRRRILFCAGGQPSDSVVVAAGECAPPLLHDALEPRRLHFHYPPPFEIFMRSTSSCPSAALLDVQDFGSTVFSDLAIDRHDEIQIGFKICVDSANGAGSTPDCWPDGCRMTSL